jgi:hypothetical protein
MFTDHPPDTPERRLAHEAINRAAIQFAETLNEVCPASAETMNAFAKVMEARMWANAAVAIHLPTGTPISMNSKGPAKHPENWLEPSG